MSASIVPRAMTVAVGLSLTASCTARLAPAEAKLDDCLIHNMAAVSMLEEDIAATEDLLTRARMTEEHYQSVQAELAEQRETIEHLLSLRHDMLHGEHLDDSEQAARASVLMSAYKPGADAAIAKARADDLTAADLAAKATSCAQSLAE